jgi:hypothetical protein
MNPEALFINGVYESVLLEIIRVQSVLPEQVLFLQPYSSGAMAHLQAQPPTSASPMRLFLSTTTDLATVRYVGEIVGWDDKRSLAGPRWAVLNRVIAALQPDEGGLYDLSSAARGKCVNLLHVRRLQRLEHPFSVELLRKTSDGTPISSGRATAGGWVYVQNVDPAQLVAPRGRGA